MFSEVFQLSVNQLPKLPKVLVRIANLRPLRHLLGIPIIIFISGLIWLFLTFLIAGLLIPSTAFAQAPLPSVDLSDKDITETIHCFKTTDVKEAVEQFKKQMPPPVSDPKQRAQIIDNLPAPFIKLRIRDEKLEKRIARLLEPVLSLYDRTDYYKLIIVNHPTPLFFSDSGVALVVTTGELMQIRSDDELLGYVAHEVGHEYFAQYSIYTKYLLAKVVENGKELPLSRRLDEMLALIELECDAFSALTLKYLGYDALAFIEGFERTARDYPNYSTGAHPPESVRRRVVSEILQSNLEIGQSEAGESKTNSKRTVSPELASIKSYINLNYSKPVSLPPVMRIR